MLRLDELQEGGAVFPYPDALSPLEWAALGALQRARRRDAEKSKPDTAGKQQQANETARLEQRLAKPNR